VRFALTTLLLVASFGAFAADKVKISTVPHEFTPYSGSGSSEPVSLSEFYFEVNAETRRARVVVNYGFRGQAAVESEDRHAPVPTYAQLPELIYDTAAQAVVYESRNLRTICATVTTGRGVFGSRTKVKSTGNCFVTTQSAERTEDDGWGIRRYPVLDVYLETR
jgi:hypothetical protein